MRKQIYFVSHCILNTAAKVVMFDTSELEKENAMRREFLQLALEQDIQLVQLPCPEFTLYGAKRWGHVKDQFDNPFFRSHCKSLLQPVIDQMLEYSGNSAHYEVLGVVGIDGSPSCGVTLTCKGGWGGELSGNERLSETIQGLQMENESGVLMEILRELLTENGLHIEIIGLSTALLGQIRDRENL